MREPVGVVQSGLRNDGVSWTISDGDAALFLHVRVIVV